VQKERLTPYGLCKWGPGLYPPTCKTPTEEAHSKRVECLLCGSLW